MRSNPADSTGQLVDQIVAMQRMLGQFTRLIEISLTLNTTVDQQELLEFIIGTGTNILDCSSVSILLYDDKKNQLRFAAASGSTDPKELAKIPVPLDSSIAGTIFTENRPEVINNLSQDPRHFQKVGQKTQQLMRNLIGVPMRIHDRTTGVMEAINKRDGDFTKEDVDILSVIASQAAVAINNANMMNSLQEANLELERIDKIKNDFMALASHELRTPLGVLLGYATILQEDAEGELSGHADKVINSALKLRSLVEDMTNLTMLEMGSQDIQLQKVPIQRIVADAFTETQETLETKKHNHQIHLPKEPIYVMADPEKLGKALMNLLNNAIRFTPVSGEIMIAVRQEDDLAHVYIKDTGIGIPAHELEAIFEDFHQVEDHMTRLHGGMGLGLPIARGLVNMQDGQIWAESEGKDKGSTFHITLPIAD